MKTIEKYSKYNNKSEEKGI